MSEQEALTLEYWQARFTIRHTGWPAARVMAYTTLRRVARQSAGRLREQARRDYMRLVGVDPTKELRR